MADAAAHVHLGRRLREREEVRAEPRLALRAEHLLAQVVHRALQVAERDAAIHHQALDLVELRQVGRVGHVAAVHLARSDHVDGQLSVLHRVHLHAGSLRAQKHVGLAAHVACGPGAIHHIERVGQTAAGMVGRSVQRLEIVIARLHLGALRHRVAQAQEDLGYLVDDAVDEMARADLLGTTRQRHVHGRRVDGRSQLGGLERRLALGERRLHLHAHLVHSLAHLGALLLGHLPHAAQVACERAGFAQHGHAHLVERGGVARLRDGGQRPLAQRRHVLHDCHTPFFPFRLFPHGGPRLAAKKEPSRVLACWETDVSRIQGREKALAVPPRLTASIASRPPRRARRSPASQSSSRPLVFTL